MTRETLVQAVEVRHNLQAGDGHHTQEIVTMVKARAGMVTTRDRR